MSTTNDARPPGALSERVQSLRLPARGGRGGGGKLPWVLCGVFALAAVAFGVQAFTRPAADADKQPQGPPGVDGKTADSGDVVLQAKGYAVPFRTIQVSPQVGGRIQKLTFQEGDRVKKGDVLAELEDIEYRTRWERAVAKHAVASQTHELTRKTYPAEVERAKHDLTETRAELDRSRDQLRRMEQVGGVAQSLDELTRIRNETAMMEAKVKRKQKDLDIADLGKFRVETSKSEMEATKAELDEARWRLDNCIIRAPVSGTILTKKAEESNLVNPAAFKVEANLCEMANLSEMEIDLQIQERDIDKIVVGQQCLVMPEAYQKNEKFLKLHEKGYAGEVSRLMPIADRSKGSIPVRVKVTVPEKEEGVYLKPDMGVIVSFKKTESK